MAGLYDVRNESHPLAPSSGRQLNINNPMLIGHLCRQYDDVIGVVVSLLYHRKKIVYLLMMYTCSSRQSGAAGQQHLLITSIQYFTQSFVIQL